MSTSVLKALPGKLDIKRHLPSILYILPCLIFQLEEEGEDEGIQEEEEEWEEWEDEEVEEDEVEEWEVEEEEVEEWEEWEVEEDEVST